MSFTLVVNGEKQPDHPKLSDVWQTLQEKYEGLDDQYAGVVSWEIHDRSGHLGASMETMEAGLWHACCEDPRAFSMWLKLASWAK